ncbi:MAG: tetratricopeptide repeat protein [Terracidiphilus sp.]|nr:tetratricopeptide repeat protein [Terracidiphilus sp.]
MPKPLSFFCLAVWVLFTAVPANAQATAEQQRAFAQHVQKAQGYLRDKHPDLAIPELQAAAALNPDNFEVQGNLGVLLFFQGKPADAIPHLRIAIEKQPSLANMQGILGMAELRTQDFASGRKDLEAAFPVIEDRKLKVQAGLELVGYFTATGDLDQAAPILAALRRFAPDNPEVLYAAYRTYTDLSGESMLALGIAAPDTAQFHQMMAHELIKKGRTNEAIAEYRKALVVNPHLPGAHFELAELLNTSQDAAIKRDAQQEYRAALSENPSDEKALCRLAEIDAQRGDFQASLDKFTRASELQPSDGDAKLGMAKALSELNQNEKALALLEQTVRDEPTNGIAHYRLGTLYRKFGRIDEAKREIEIYKKLKDAKDKLRAQYKDLLIVPNEIRADDTDEK